MFNVGFTFIFSVLCLYTFYRYYFEQNDTLKQLSYVHLDWQIFYLFYTFMLINAGSKIASNVSIFTVTQIFFGETTDITVMAFSQGKITAQLIHNIINRCNDNDVNLSVSIQSI